MYKKFKGSFLGDDNSIDSMDGLEPPILDETWGLSDVKKIYDTDSETSDSDDAQSRKKRSTFEMADNAQVDDVTDVAEDDYIKSLTGESKCKAKFWRCVGTVAKGTTQYLDQPGGISGAIQKTMFRMAFHGGFGNVWNALMTIPEARNVKKCMNAQEQCLNYEIIRAEVGNTSTNEKPRLIVNPDFVEGKDTSDGKKQWSNGEEEEFFNNV